MKQITWTVIVGGNRTTFTLPRPCRLFTIGRDNTDYAVFSDVPVKVSCMMLESGVTLKGDAGTTLRMDGESFPSVQVSGDAKVTVDYAGTPDCFELEIHVTDGLSQPNMDRCLELPEGRISFGSREECNVRIPVQGREREAFYLSREGDKTQICTAGIPFGVYVNEKKLFPNQPRELKQNDFIFTAGSCFVFTTQGELMTTSDVTVQGLNYTDRTDSISHLEYPHMIRTTRYHYEIPSEPIEVLDPPKLQEKPAQNLIVILLPVVMLVLIYMFAQGSGSGGMGIMTIGMMGIGAVTSVYTFIKDRRDFKKKRIRRQEQYEAYLEEQEEYIRGCREDERDTLTDIYITPEQELRNVEEFAPDLFDRTGDDRDFLHIRLGYGRLLSGRQIKTVEHKELTDKQDTLMEEPERLRKKYEYNERMPAYVEGTQANAIGVLGNQRSLERVMNQVTLDLVTRQMPEDLELYLLCDKDFDGHLQAYRMLPHVWNKYSNRRNIAADPESRNQLLEELYKRLADREAAENSGGSWIVIYVHTDSEVMQHPLMRFVPRAASLRTVFIFWSQQREDLPIGCSSLIRLFNNENSGVIVDMYDKQPDKPFTYVEIDNSTMEKMAIRLAPVYVSEITLASNLTSQYTLFDALGITVPDAEKVKKNWEEHSAQKSLSVPIGINSSNAEQTLDLHERGHGPHGLVAGTTGSGKSEVIISYLMSLAWHFSPEDVNIAVIDFKGGGMGNQLEGLPHLTSVITNLEGGELDRSLSSIKAELLYRQRVLAEANVGNISDYIVEYKAGRVTEPLPHLLLVVDEFAELKAQQPEFMNELISAARIGRSLGVHLILSTQKPTGVVNDQIMSNMDFRMCLRVQTREDSNEVIESPLAAEIREPGRAYLRVNRCEMFQLFQSGYSGGPADNTEEKQNKFSVSELSLTGRRSVLYEYAPDKEKKDDNDGERAVTQFTVAKDAIIRAWKELGARQPRKLCMPPLPREAVWKPVEQEDIYQLPVGLVDMPQTQQQLPMTVNIGGDNTLIVGGSQTGKTTLLQTMIRAAAETMKPTDVSFYIMDFNSGVFKTMEKLNLIGGVVTLDDEEKLKNLLKMIRDEIAARKERFLEAGVLSFSAYRETVSKELPALVMMIDNFAVFKEVYDDKYGDVILQILRDGPAAGVSVFATAGQGTPAVGYKRMCYFDNRIVFYCADTAEYSDTLEGCRKTLPEIPGRVMIRLDKTILNAQVYLPFEGETDLERMEESRKLTERFSQGAQAKQIPAIPALLTRDVLEKMFAITSEPPMIPYALSYADVEPVYADLTSDFELALIGNSKSGNAQLVFLQQFISSLLRSGSGAHIRIVDGLEKTLREYREDENVLYVTDAAAVNGMVEQMAEIAQERFDRMDEEGEEFLEKAPYEVLILNNTDALKEMSDDAESVSRFERMGRYYRRTRIFFLFAGLENRQIPYGAPDMLRHVKEMQQTIVFENANQIKIFDIPLSQVNANRDKLGRNDAFLVSEDQMLQRIRLVSTETAE